MADGRDQCLGFCENGEEIMVSVEVGECIGQVSGCRLLEEAVVC